MTALQLAFHATEHTAWTSPPWRTGFGKRLAASEGRPKNVLAHEHILRIYELYRDWRAEEGLSAVVTTQEATRNDYNLSPSRYVASNEVEPPLPLEEARAEAEAELDAVLSGLGFAGWRAS